MRGGPATAAAGARQWGGGWLDGCVKAETAAACMWGCCMHHVAAVFEKSATIQQCRLACISPCCAVLRYAVPCSSRDERDSKRYDDRDRRRPDGDRDRCGLTCACMCVC